MIWYKASLGRIFKVEVSQTTEKFVIFPSGRRDAKNSDWRWYRPTFEEAKAVLLEDAMRKWDIAKQKTVEAGINVRNIADLKEGVE